MLFARACLSNLFCVDIIMHHLFFLSEHRLQVLEVDQLVNEAIEANKNNEVMEVEARRFNVLDDAQCWEKGSCVVCVQ